eukprot:scaffold472_cov109-Isochrysis_galbana.AAC.5
MRRGIGVLCPSPAGSAFRPIGYLPVRSTASRAHSTPTGTRLQGSHQPAPVTVAIAPRRR